jgi:hypothetical protein
MNGIISTRVFVPADDIDIDRVEKLFTYERYNDSACDKCPLRPDRPTDTCYGCQHYLGEIRTYREKTIRGRSYIALPPGDLSRIEKLFSLDISKFRDRRPVLKLPYDLRFTGKLYEGQIVNGERKVNQVRVVNDWLKTKSGLVQSPPRSGKTAMACYISCELGVKTLIVAHNVDLLRQFYKTYMDLTNVRRLRTKTGKRIVGIVKKVEDIKKYDICLLNYQKFIKQDTATARIKKYLKGKFSLVVVDEVHASAALAYAKFVSRLDCRYRLGLSATPKRKDFKDVITRDFIGPVLAKAESISMKPKIELVETGIYTKYQYRSWVGAMQFLAASKQRKKLIVREVFKDLRAGHEGIIIPVDYKHQAMTLCNMINQQAEVNNDKRDENWPEETAVVFHAKSNRKELLAGIESRKYKVLIAIRSMIKQGIDLSVPTMLYMVVPMSATQGVGAPMFEQLSFRVATHREGKRQPICKIFLDGIGFSHGCFKGLWWREIHPKLDRRGNPNARYIVDEYDYKRMVAVAGLKEYTPVNEPGIRVTSRELLENTSVNKTEGNRVKRHF